MIKTLMYEAEITDQIVTCFRHAKEFSIGMALITQGGIDLIMDELRSCLERGGQGRILIGIDMPTDPNAIEYLFQLQSDFKSQLKLRIFQSSKQRIFHPKLWVFRSQHKQLSAIVGSANLTQGGLVKNYEVSVYLDDQQAARNCLDYFDENFKGGHTRTIDEEWIDKYRSQYAVRLKAMKALQKARERVLRLRAKRIASKPIPPRVRGYKFGFTGKIEGWPRDNKLYPLVQKLGGLIALRAGSVPSADCLVHGQILGGRKSTLKLNSAEKNEVPIISDEDFFVIVSREKKRRQRAKGRG